MAERQSKRTSSSATRGRTRTSSANGSPSRRLSGRDAIERVREEVPNVLGLVLDSIVGLERSDSNGWTVTVEVVELARIPRSTDVLGAYDVTLDGHGELIGARRRGRYHRNQANGDGD